MVDQRALEAIEHSDTDELLRVIDGLCESDNWKALVELKLRCREAVGRGKQLWGVEEHARYRLALEAPGNYAGAALNEGVARFSLGPLPEVAAMTKSWADLSPHLDDGPWRNVVAAERVLRGDLEVSEIGDLPPSIQSWEPEYMLATYKSDKVEAPSPDPVAVATADIPESFITVDDPHSDGALTDLVQPWATESNGRYQISSVEGEALSAIRALGLTRARVGRIDPKLAMAWMAWAGASGGAHGRRRGAAAGRYGVWWVICTLGDLDWPPDPDEVGTVMERMTFFWFDDGAPRTGWELKLAIEDPESALAWAVSAVDLAD